MYLVQNVLEIAVRHEAPEQLALAHHTAAQISAITWRRRFRPAHGGTDFRQNFGQHIAAQIFAKISAITRRRRFRQNFGHHTAAQIFVKISASTRRRRFSPNFRPSHGGAEFRFHFVSFSFRFRFVFVFVFVSISF